MLNETMWSIFTKTGDMNAYLYTKEYKEYLKENKEHKDFEFNRTILNIREITII